MFVQTCRLTFDKNELIKKNRLTNKRLQAPCQPQSQSKCNTAALVFCCIVIVVERRGIEWIQSIAF